MLYNPTPNPQDFPYLTPYAKTCTRVFKRESWSCLSLCLYQENSPPARMRTLSHSRVKGLKQGSAFNRGFKSCLVLLNNKAHSESLLHSTLFRHFRHHRRPGHWVLTLFHRSMSPSPLPPAVPAATTVHMPPKSVLDLLSLLSAPSYTTGFALSQHWCRQL